MVSSGKFVRTGLPVVPFVMEKSKYDTSIKRISVGTYEKLSLVRKEFGSVTEYNEYFTKGSSDRSNYLELVYSYNPDFFYRYPSDDPKIMALDIEVLTDGSGVFPVASEKPIVAIGVKIVGTNDVKIFAVDKIGDRCDLGIICDLLEYVQDADPDIIATYNGVRFDIDYLMKRMEVHGLSPSVLMRRDFPGTVVQKRNSYDPNIVTPQNFPGRIHWDLWVDVNDDKTLLGMPNKRLKTVANHFGWSNIIDLGRDALSNTAPLVGTDELNEYLASDVILTEKLTGVYLGMKIAVSEIIGVPLREYMTSYSSMISKIIHVRNMHNEYIALDTNSRRYKKLLGNMSYQSAKVALYKDGVELGKDDSLHEYYPDVNKVDFSSQYPSAMMTFNLSPDTTRIMEVREYTGDFKFVTKEGKNLSGKEVKYLWLDVPDANMNKQITIRIDMSKDGFLRKVLNQFKDERGKIKRLMKDNPDDKSLYSQQWAIKVIMNAMYGYEGLATATWGDISVAIATVSLCRYLIEEVERLLGNRKIETDTDGVIINGTVDIDRINEHISKFICDRFKVKSEMGIEMEPVGEGFFYRMKNYVTRNPAGKITRKGVVFKSSRHSRIYDKALNTMIDAVMKRLDKDQIWEVIKKVKDMSQYDLTDFIMSARLNYDVEEYSDPNAMQATLARQAMEELGIEVGKGGTVDYIVTKGGKFTVASLVSSKSEVDFGYYENDIDKILTVFALSNIRQMELF
jgi:DNA polymerase I